MTETLSNMSDENILQYAEDSVKEISMTSPPTDSNMLHLITTLIKHSRATEVLTSTIDKDLEIIITPKPTKQVRSIIYYLYVTCIKPLSFGDLYKDDEETKKKIRKEIRKIVSNLHRSRFLPIVLTLLHNTITSKNLELKNVETVFQVVLPFVKDNL